MAVEDLLTGKARQRFQRVITEDEMKRFLESSRERFGRDHNTAYVLKSRNTVP